MPVGLGAEKNNRQAEFEWEAVEGVGSYELEIRSANLDNNAEDREQKYNFIVTDSRWTGKLEPGSYKIKMRSFDQRRIPGPWSSDIDLHVKLFAPVELLPLNEDVIHSQVAEKQAMHFSWEALKNALNYQIEVRSTDGSVTVSEFSKENTFDIELPVAKSYLWRVTPFSRPKIRGDSTSEMTFSINGPNLEAPEIEVPPSDFVRELTWSKPELATGYDVTIFRKREASESEPSLEPSTNEWLQVYREDQQKEVSVTIPSDWRGGTYKIEVKALASLRESSKVAELIFELHSGDRSRMAEMQSIIRGSIEKKEGWHGIGSYLITEVQYQGQNFDDLSQSKFRAIGGTGRLGVGYSASKYAWGFLGIADHSGFYYSNKNHTFNSTELSATYKFQKSLSEIRLQAGLYSKEIPDIVGDGLSSEILNESKISAMGPHLGVEYWRSFNSKIGFQINAHWYYSLFYLTTPNGRAGIPTNSYQLGFLGSYRLSRNFTGLVGYAKRLDTLAYQTKSSLGKSGEGNTSSVSGNYINFITEVSL